MKRTIAVVVSLALTVSALAGCGNEKQNKVGNQNQNEFSYWVEMPGSLVSQCQSLGEISMFQELEKQTGIKINFIHPPAGQAAEQFNLMIASRELPDLIEYAWTSYQGGPDKAINDNIIIKLNDFLESDAPNYKSVIQSDKKIENQSKTDTGKFYGFPTINNGKYRTFGGLIIRQDWLDDLGLAVPETIEEWETVLRAFKNQKGAKAPITFSSDAFSNSGINHFNNAFNVGLGVYLEDGKIQLAQFQPGYKKFIELMNKWYKEGLLDNEYTTNNGTVVDAKMTNGTSGVTYGYIGGTIGRYMTSMKGKDSKYKLTGVQYPVMNKGDEPRFIERQADVSNPFVAVTSVCKDPKKAVEWIDFLYSDKGNILKNFGVEGKTYNLVDGKHIYTDEILKNPNGLSIAEAMSRHFRANTPAPGFSQNEEYLMQYYQLDEQKQALETWSKFADNAKGTTMPPITPLMEESEELSGLSTEISTYSAEMILKFIKGDEPMSNFDKFIADLKAMGAERVIELNQIAYERYNSR